MCVNVVSAKTNLLTLPQVNREDFQIDLQNESIKPVSFGGHGGIEEIYGHVRIEKMYGYPLPSEDVIKKQRLSEGQNKPVITMEFWE